MKTYDTYLFDWDGTLAQTLEAWLLVIREMHQKYNNPVTDRQIADTFGSWKAPLELGISKKIIHNLLRNWKKNPTLLLQKLPCTQAQKNFL